MDQSQPAVETSGPRRDGRPNGTLPEPGDPSPRAGASAAGRRWDGQHFIDVRLSIPLIFMRVYVTLVAGKERRGKARRRAERAKHPLATLGNSFFFSTTGALVGLAAFAVVVVASVLLIRQLFSVEITLR